MLPIKGISLFVSLISYLQCRNTKIALCCRYGRVPVYSLPELQLMTFIINVTDLLSLLVYG